MSPVPFQIRAVVGLSILLGVFVCLLGRLFFIQVVQKVVQIAKQVKELVELIGGKASGEQPHTMSTQQVESATLLVQPRRLTRGGVPAPRIGMTAGRSAARRSRQGPRAGASN